VNKLGTIIRVKNDSKIGDSVQSSLSVQTLLGKRDDPLLELLGRQLFEMIQKASSQKSVLLAVALKEGQSSPESLKKILALLACNRT